MAKRFDVRITLVSQIGKCPAGHKVGDQWTIHRFTPAGMCMGAFNSLSPFITTFRFGGVFPWEDNPNEAMFCCPDPKVVNTFKVERIVPEGEVASATEIEHC